MTSLDHAVSLKKQYLTEAVIRGRTLTALERYVESRVSLDRALTSSGEENGYGVERAQAQAYDAMGEWFLRQGYYAEARTGFERPLALDLLLVEAWRHKAEALLARGDAEGAAQAREQAAALEAEQLRMFTPDDSTPWL